MLDHLTLPVTDYSRSKAFYDKTLNLLGYECLANFEVDEAIIAGYGRDGKPSFWIGEPKGDLPKNGKRIDSGFIRGLHFSFLAPSVESIQQWYQSCLTSGGKSNGKPGPRPQYHEGYYGAFIIDPDGWKIEACLHDYNLKA